MNNFSILEEGYKHIILTFLLSLVIKFFVSDILGNIGIILGLFLIFIYRNPHRDIFGDEQSVLSLVDGKVKAIDYINGKYLIYCDIDLCDTHILRAPVTGKMKIKSFNNGLNLRTDSYKAKQLNESMVIKFSNLKVRLLSGVCNIDILIDDKQVLEQGERLGLFFSGMAIIEMKKDINLSIKIGDKLKAGQTVIGKYLE
jgi:phosphatidylserine decarboxylase